MVTDTNKYERVNRVTINLSGEAYRLVRLIAADRGTSAANVMTDMVEQAARAAEVAK